MLQAHDTVSRSSAPLRRGCPIGRVVVINDFSEARGGATGVAILSASLLQAQGISVTYFGGDDTRRADPRLAPVEVVPAGGQHILLARRLQAMRNGLYNRSAEHALADWIAKNDTPNTVYHLHGWSKILSPSVFHALRKVAARLVISAHDYFLVCPNGGYFDFNTQDCCELRPMSAACVFRSCDKRRYSHKLWRVFRHGIRRALFDLSAEGATVLAVHDGMIPILQSGGIPSGRLAALRNPVTAWSAGRARPENNKVFLFVGRFEEEKGVDLFLAAARAAGVPARVIGDGPLRDKLRDIYPQAEIVPWCTRDQIATHASDARAVVLPSRVRETFGLAAFEALASGIPVVISRFALVADEIAACGGAVVCDPRDKTRFCEILSRLASDDDLVWSMSARAYAHAPDFSLSPLEWVTRLIDLYERILPQRNELGRRCHGAKLEQ